MVISALSQIGYSRIGLFLLQAKKGRWGKQEELDRFLQACAAEKAKIEARRKGHSVTEQPLADGAIKLTVNVGGADR